MSSPNWAPGATAAEPTWRDSPGRWLLLEGTAGHSTAGHSSQALSAPAGLVAQEEAEGPQVGSGRAGPQTQISCLHIQTWVPLRHRPPPPAPPRQCARQCHSVKTSLVLPPSRTVTAVSPVTRFCTVCKHGTF